jgi:hypothetical protein
VRDVEAAAVLARGARVVPPRERDPVGRAAALEVGVAGRDRPLVVLREAKSY